MVKRETEVKVHLLQALLQRKEEMIWDLALKILIIKSMYFTFIFHYILRYITFIIKTSRVVRILSSHFPRENVYFCLDSLYSRAHYFCKNCTIFCNVLFQVYSHCSLNNILILHDYYLLHTFQNFLT